MTTFFSVLAVIGAVVIGMSITILLLYVALLVNVLVYRVVRYAIRACMGGFQ